MLTAVIPVYGPTYAEREENLKAILKSSINLKFVIVADTFNESDKLTIGEFIGNNKEISAKIVFGDFGNPGSARNAGLELIDTDWFCFWDSDDKPYCDNFIELAEQALFRKCKIAKGGYEIVESVNNIPLKTIIPVGNVEPLAQHIVDPGLWRYAFDRKYYGHLRFPAIRMGEDQDYLVQALLLTDEIFILKEVVYSYKVGSDDQLTQNATSFADVGKSLTYLRSLLGDAIIHSDKEEIVVTSYLKQLLTSVKRDKYQILDKKTYPAIYFILFLLLRGRLFRPLKYLISGRK